MEGASKAAQPQPQGSGRPGAQHGRLCRGLQGEALSMGANEAGADWGLHPAPLAGPLSVRLTPWKVEALAYCTAAHLNDAVCMLGACKISYSTTPPTWEGMQTLSACEFSAMCAECWIAAHSHLQLGPSRCQRAGKTDCRQGSPGAGCGGAGCGRGWPPCVPGG